MLNILFVLSFALMGKASGYVIINQVMYDTPLNEVVTVTPYSNGEFVELYNPTNDTIDITGWHLYGDGYTESYTFDSLKMPPQCYVILAYRHKKNVPYALDSLYENFITAAETIVLYHNSIILSNSGETLRLTNAQNQLVDAVYYDGTSNKRNPDRLHADNENNTLGDSCVSLHRTEVHFDRNGQCINSRWTTDKVSFFTHRLGDDYVFIPENYLFKDSLLSLSQNFIVSVTPLDATARVTMDNHIPSVEGGIRAITTIDYFDGLGRKQGTVMPGFTPAGANLYSYQSYNDFENLDKVWLPTPVENLNFVTGSTFADWATDYYADSRPFVEHTYENSEQKRLLFTHRAGTNWATHPVMYQYGTAYNDTVKNFDVGASGDLICKGVFVEGALYKTHVADEDGKCVTTFTDKLGRIILERRAHNYDTYYVYDDLNRLRYVLPPIVADSINVGAYDIEDGLLKRWAYVYRYDGRGNIIYKRLPGCDAINMVYDQANRLVAQQDGNMRNRTSWLVYKYDNIGRVVYTALLNRDITAQEQKEIANNMLFEETFDTQNDFAGTGYTSVFFVNELVPLTVNYYDNYDFLTTLSPEIGEQLTATVFETYDQPVSSVHGRLTGSRVYHLYDSACQVTANYYDYQGRLIQQCATSPMGGYNRTCTAYNFDGTISRALMQYHNERDSLMERYAYTYDHAGRLLTTTYQIDTLPSILLVKNVYDELGRLAQKTRHNDSDTTTYGYNIHHWLTDIANSQFTEHIVYNGSASANSYYNGNIAQTMVQHDAVPVCTNYTYDEVNRLTLAQNADHATQREAFAYDKMGNVLELRRDSIDHLSLTYSGNQLIQVSDAQGNCMHATEYRDLATEMAQEMAYDANGNLQYDLDRRISAIHYNLLNLPELICFMDGRKIVNLYDAAGRKHGTGYYVQDDSLPAYSTWYDGHYERTDYADTLVPSLCRVHHAEGYVSSGREAATPPVIHYYHRDHLGNTCAVWNATADSVVQRTLYYAGGMPMAGSTGQPYQPYKYNGKEFVTEYGYDEYDSQARWYYPAVMRTTTIDPLSEKYYAASPYVWCANNSVKYVDPSGMFGVPIHKDITQQSMKMSSFVSTTSLLFYQNLSLGATIVADYVGFAENWHFDNMANYSDVQTRWNTLNANITATIGNIGSCNKLLGGIDVLQLGVLLHNVQDFYAHSNYAELYIEYFQGVNNGALPSSLPTYDEGIKNSNFNNLLKEKLRTGDFHMFDNEIIDINPFREHANEPTSHNKINKDKADTYAGKLAKQAAINHTTKILKTLE